MSYSAEIRDALVAKIATSFPPTPPDEVIGKYTVDIDSASISGRKVFVFPSAVASPEPATRSADYYDYGFALMVVERYESEGNPTEEWVDERVTFVESLWATLGDSRSYRLLADPDDPTSGLWCQGAEIVQVYDPEALDSRDLFIAIIALTFREISQ